jgi:hypothetical protein
MALILLAVKNQVTVDGHFWHFKTVYTKLFNYYMDKKTDFWNVWKSRKSNKAELG